MRHKHLTWANLAVALSILFSVENTLSHYIISGIIAVFLFVLLYGKQHRRAFEIPEPADHIRAPAGSSLFHRARHFVLNNPIMTCIQGEDQTPRIMELLSNHIILGAAYDDSARSYPPRCHPGTRVRILDRLTLWLQDGNPVKSLLWLSGVAGVGKSAIMQTLAEYIVLPGASLFVSQPNKRNDPNRIFTTIAYQLAVHIEPYRRYIVDLLAVNPYLLHKSMDVQFQVFIVQPFVERKIGASHRQRWAILLDGLDELEGEQAQRDVIRLISTVTQEHPEAPLAWIIASRPEPHICDTFAESKVRDSHDLQYIPIDSPEASGDVERFLRQSFDAIRNQFPRSVPADWPKDSSIVRLAQAASGLFIFADTAVRFIKDPDHANPVSRLQLVLSVLARSKGASIKEQPFALLDELYRTILSHIPSSLWQTTKLLMRLALLFRINDRFLGLSPSSKSRTLRGMAMILGLDRYTVYPSLNKCYSMLGIPPWEEAHEKTLTFLHFSFAEFLMNPERSGDFAIVVDGVEEAVFDFYLDSWRARFLAPDDSFMNDATCLEPIDNFDLLEDASRAILTQMRMEFFRDSGSPRLPAKRLNFLRQIDTITLCCYSSSPPLSVFVENAYDALQLFPTELRESGLFCQVPFQDIAWECLDLRKQRALKKFSLSETFKGFKRLPFPSPQPSVEDFLHTPGEPLVLIFGAVPRARVALFNKSRAEYYYLVPYYG